MPENTSQPAGVEEDELLTPEDQQELADRLDEARTEADVDLYRATDEVKDAIVEAELLQEEQDGAPEAEDDEVPERPDDVDLYRAEPEVKEAIKEAEAIAAEENPTVATYDKSVGLDSDSDDPRLPEYPDYGHVVRQGGVPQWRTDQDTEYADPEVVTGSQIALDREQAPEAPVRVGDGPDAGQVTPEAPQGPSVVQGNQDTVPKDRQRPALSLREQVERGIGTPSPFAAPDYSND